MEHSVLGTRWVYDAAGDPVGRAALVRGAPGEQPQALLEDHGPEGVTARESEMRVRAAHGAPTGAEGDGAALRIARWLGIHGRPGDAVAGRWLLVAPLDGADAALVGVD